MSVTRRLSAVLVLAVAAQLACGAPAAVSTVALVTTVPPAGTPTPPAATPDLALVLTQAAAGQVAHVAAADGSAELLIPDGALPEGVALADLSITVLDPADGTATVDGGPPLAVYVFEPDGLVFAAPVIFSATLPAGDTLPLLFSATADDLEMLARVNVQPAAVGGGRVVTVPLAHFSHVVAAEGFFLVQLENQTDTYTGVPFSMDATVLRFRDSIDVKVKHFLVTTTTTWKLDAEWSLGGRFLTGPPLSPWDIKDKPPAETRVTGGSSTATGDLECVGLGPATVSYRVTIDYVKENRGVKSAGSAVGLVTGLPFNCRDGSASPTPKPTQPITAVAVATNTGNPWLTGDLPVITRFKATFVQADFSTYYEVEAYDPAGGILLYEWSISPTCGVFTWTATSPKARWSHPHPPCPPGGNRHPGVITVKVSDAAGHTSTFRYPYGSADTDEQLRPEPTPSATP